MTTPARRTQPSTKRNATVIGASAVAVGLLMLYPTSTNSGGAQRRPGQALAPVGIVTPSPGSPASTASTAPTVVNGTSADTPYGPVQVQIVVRAHTIISAIAIDYPQGTGQDQQINSFAIPVLQQETVRAQSAQIDTVSGATYTSGGYRRSLQAAIDTAHLR